MSELRKAAEQALEALEGALSDDQPYIEKSKKAAEALRQALAQPEEEPVAWFIQYEDSHEFVWSKPDGWRVKQALEIQPLYTAPPKKEWVGLADQEIMEGLSSFNEYGNLDGFSFAQWVENKLKEKNNADA